MALKRNGGTKNRVGKVIDVLRNLDQISFRDEDVENLNLVLSLSNTEITEIKRWLENENPGAAKLMFELRRSLPNDLKFDARMMMIGVFYFLVEQELAKEPPKRKLKEL